MLKQRWSGSLVNRAVALVVAVIFMTALVVTVAGSLFSRSELQAQAEKQVETIARLVATELDEKLARRRDVLNHVANGISPEASLAGERGRELIKRYAALEELFDAVFMIDEQGIVVAEHPQRYQQVGLDASQRDYFKQVSSQFTPIISDPFISNYQYKPAIMLAAPVFDEKQRFIGMLGGAIELDGRHFLDDFTNVQIGETGYLAVATRSGTTVAHGRTGEVMVPVRVANPMVQKALFGYEGTGQTNNSAGDDTIMSVMQLAQVPWFVAAVWPTKEALAPTIRLYEAFFWTLLVVVAVLVPAGFWVFRRLLAPLQTLERQIQERHQGVRTSAVRVSGGREIDHVAQTFNQVMEEREEVLASLADREAFFRSLTHSAPIGIVQTDVLGRIEFANPAFETIAGQTDEELRHTVFLDGVYEGDRGAATAGLRQVMSQHRVFRGRLRLQNRDGDRYLWADVMSSAIETREKVLGAITVVRDITHELEVETALKQEQQVAQSILNVLQEGVVLVDPQGVIDYANGSACQFLGVGRDHEGRNFFDLVALEQRGEHLTTAGVLACSDVDNCYVTLRNTAKEAFDIDLTLFHIRKGSQEERLVFVLRDDSERRREKERLSWQATHDSLTHLLNRRAFSASLVTWLSEAPRQQTSSILMLIDLDHFKPVNDEGGHLLGDDLLKRLAELFKASVRQSDTVARLGGDEFGIILPACGFERAEALAEKIRVGVEALRIERDGRSFGVTASIGLTDLTAGDTGPRGPLARADQGTYDAKDRGRNGVVVVPAPRNTSPQTP